MLKLLYGERETCSDMLGGIDGFFELQVEDEYKVSDFAKKVVKEVDNSEIVNLYSVKSPILGAISMNMISGGAKCLIIAKYYDIKIPLDYFGENCYRLLVEIAANKDVTLVTDDVCIIQKYVENNYGMKDVPIMLLNNGEVYTNNKKMVDTYLQQFNCRG